MARKKKKKSSFRASLKRALLKYGCLALFLPGWLIAPPQYDFAVTFLLALACYAYIEAFNWREDAKSDRRTKRIKLLARFWRYGYFVLAAALSLLIRMEQRRLFLFAAISLYGGYTIVIACALCKHFICGMQDASRQPMNPWKRTIPTASCQRDGLFMGFFFLIFGIIGLTVA